jgi:cytochrome oxidase Cu insertion factor (SCO1/SenC/PrrC family)
MRLANLKQNIAMMSLLAMASIAIASPPSSLGPQGLMLWGSPRDLPELSFEDGDGNPLTLANFEGKLVLLNIWAT